LKLIDFSTRRPVSVFIFAVAAVVFGMVAFSKLATDLLPDITYPSVTVRTTFAGAAPVEVESLITRPIENAVGVVNNVVRVTSSSRAETSEVTLEFAWGTNMDFAALDVRERLDRIRLPLIAERPILLRYDPSLDPILRIGISGDTDLVRLRLIAEERLQRALERIEGVAAVLVSGGLEEEIQVEIDERKMSNLGLSIDRVGQRLAQENVNLTGGRLREGQTEYLVRTVNEFLRPEDIANTVIDRSRGAVVRLRDIGRVFKGHKEREIITRIDGRESVEVAVYKEGGTNTVTVANAVTGSLDNLTSEMRVIDPNLDLTVITDQSRYIRQSVNEVLSTAVLGGSLAIVVLFFFLRSFKTTVIIGISIPISVVATFFLMYTFGVSLNIMSLGGLTLGIGLLVDNSIVVLEAIQRKRDQGMGEVEAARAGTGEVARGGCQYADHGLRLCSDRLCRGDRRPAVWRSGIDRHLLLGRLAAGRSDGDSDARLASFRLRRRGGAGGARRGGGRCSLRAAPGRLHSFPSLAGGDPLLGRPRRGAVAQAGLRRPGPGGDADLGGATTAVHGGV